MRERRAQIVHLDPRGRVRWGTADARTLSNANASIGLNGAGILNSLNVNTTGATTGQIRSSGNLALNSATHVIEMNNITDLADGATANLLQSAARYGLYFVTCATDVQAALFIYDGATLTIVSDPASTFSSTDSANKHCILLSGTTLTLKNNRGAAKSYRVTRFN